MTRTSTAPHAESTVMTAPSARRTGMTKHCDHVARANSAPATTDLAALYAAQSGPAPTPRGTRVVPGPMIVAHVGDTLVVRLINHLPEPTVIHWHGLRLPAGMDETDRVSRRRPPRHVDVPLPHPRASRGRCDGALRGRALTTMRRSGACVRSPYVQVGFGAHP